MKIATIQRAGHIQDGLIVYVYDDLKPKQSYNKGMVVVSKQPNSMHTFCVDKSHLSYF